MDQSNNLPPNENTIEATEPRVLNNETNTAAPNPSISAVSLTEETSNPPVQTQYNHRNPAVRRIMREAQEMSRNPDNGITAHPLEDNLFEWHFTIRGTEGTEFESGLYHGRIILPAEYPMKPPSIIMLTPNGRFETGVKICLSISSYHPETWRPSWGIRTALLALQSFMNTPSPGAIGSLDLPEGERRKLARLSIGWTCVICGPNRVPPAALPESTTLAVNYVTTQHPPPSAALRVFAAPMAMPSDFAAEHIPADAADGVLHDHSAGDAPRIRQLNGPNAVDGQRSESTVENGSAINENVRVNIRRDDEIENSWWSSLGVYVVLAVIIGIVIRRLCNVIL